jgi:hypothetical protein
MELELGCALVRAARDVSRPPASGRLRPLLHYLIQSVSYTAHRVKGTLFVDYVRMLRRRGDVDWSRWLEAVDLGYLVQRIDPDAWYPMETFERMGLAILTAIAQNDLDAVRIFGRGSIDWLCQTYVNLVASGDPRDTLMRFQVLRRGFFDYTALEIASISDGEASIVVSYGMGPRAEEAASWQTLGFFERLLEVSGATQVKAWFSSRSWADDLVTIVELRWEQSPVSSNPG